MVWTLNQERKDFEYYIRAMVEPDEILELFREVCVGG
jgi:hypothetical protein